MINRLKLMLYYNLELSRLNLIACFLKFQLMILNIEKKWVLFKMKLLKILTKKRMMEMSFFSYFIIFK